MLPATLPDIESKVLLCKNNTLCQNTLVHSYKAEKLKKQ